MSSPTSPIYGFTPSRRFTNNYSPVSTASNRHSTLVLDAGAVATTEAQDLTTEPLPGSDDSNSTDSTQRELDTPPTVRSIKMADDKLRHLMAVTKACMCWDDDYDGIDLYNVKPSLRSDLLDNAQRQKENLQDAITFFSNVTTPEWTDQISSQAQEVRRKFVSWIRANMNAPDDVLTRSSSRSEQSTTSEIRLDRANAREPAVMKKADSLVDTFNQIRNQRPAVNSALRSMEQEYNAASICCTKLLKDLKDLAEDALASNNRDLVLRCDKAGQQLKELEESVHAAVGQEKARLGFLPGDMPSYNRQANMKPPRFTGEFGDGLDYYTFMKLFENYTETVGIYNHAEKALKLKSECLSGSAKDFCTHIDVYDDMVEHLRITFGRPTILFANMSAEIAKLGKCPDDYFKRRSWVISVRSKLKALKLMASQHKIMYEFDSSSVLRDIQKNIHPSDFDIFRKRMRDKQEQTECGVLPGAARLDCLLDFLQSLESWATSDIDLEMCTRRPEEMLEGLRLSKQKAKQPPPPPPGKDNRRIFAATDVPSCEQETSTPIVKNAVYASQTAEPQLVSCKSCSKKHTLLAYCTNFQRAEKIKHRWSMIIKTGSCLRCLRLDASLPAAQKHRDEWYTHHKKYCDDTWTCKLGKCAEKPAAQQHHFTLCSYHIEQNKELQADYINTLDQSKIRSSTRFFLAATPLCLHAANSQPLLPLIEPAGSMFPPPPPAVPPIVMPVSLPPPPPPPCLSVNPPCLPVAATLPPPTLVQPDVDAPPIYLLQYIDADADPTKKLLVFYDSGCFGAGISDRAYSLLNTQCVRPGPTIIEVAGGGAVKLPYGDERMWLKLDTEPPSLATMTALRMGEVSSPFPIWPLQEAWEELNKAYKSEGLEPLPTVEKEIGGDNVDIMIGIRYNKYFPRPMFQLPSGLTIFKSVFKSSGNNNGILGGPHDAWKVALKRSHLLTPRLYLTYEMNAYNSHAAALHNTLSFDVPEACCGTDLPEDPVLLDVPDCVPQCCHHSVHEEGQGFVNMMSVQKSLREFKLLDEIGADAEYRCVKCRNCNDCKKGEILERTSLVEENEQAIIEDCVRLDDTNNVLISKLPFIVDPDKVLKPNRHVAEKILESQLRIINKNPEMRADVLKSHDKLVKRGHVVEASMLPDDIKSTLFNGGYYIPWRTVYNSNSLSTPCRMVFDASSRTPLGESLNNTLAKGQNKLATLFHLLLRFRAGHSAFSADVSMAYNSLKLHPSHYRFQKYLWAPDLLLNSAVVVMVVVTMIYGVRPAGNSTMAGFVKTADHAIQTQPELTAGAEALKDSSYMDDVYASYLNDGERDNASSGLKKVLAIGGMEAKAITKSGMKPDESVSADGETVGIVGYLWRPQDDVLSLDIKPLYFGKPKRGKLPELVQGDVGEALKLQFTKRILTGKVASVFDPLGLVTPLTARLKLDLSSICKLKLGWDDLIPLEHLQTWTRNLDDIQSLRELRYRRAVIHPNAANSSFDLIVCTDASELVAVAAVYARSLLRDGTFSCQLVTAKSKLVTKSTVPRCELKAATIGAVLGHVAATNFGKYCANICYATDSTISLFWINQDQRPLQVGVRNAVIEIRRLSDHKKWFHIESQLNPADIGTRHAEIADILPDSEWQVGKPWMRLPEDKMPLRTIEQINLSQEEKRQAAQEIRNNDVHGIILSNLTSRVGQRYEFSEYLLDPCSLPWPKFLRVLATTIRCVNIWRHRAARFQGDQQGRPIVMLGEGDLAKAENYLFTKTTLEVKAFNREERLGKLGEEVDGILRYTGRVLDGQEIQAVGTHMLDLQPLTFVKPITDRFSPVSYSVLAHAHTKMTHHGGAISSLRQSRSIIYCLGGRDLAKEIRDACNYCSRKKAKLVKAELGKFHETRLIVAPAFHFCQVDLFGPLKARCEHNHRATVKVWGAVFKCSATLAVAVHCMQKYDTDAFIQAYTRFSSRYGHPAKLFIDEGTQLMKACKEMEISMTDLTKTINGRHLVQIEFASGPVGGHNVQGIVERSIQEVKKVFAAVFGGLKLDILQYETAFAWTSNELNSLPICLGSKTESLDNTDLITPARLILGRNNGRAPLGFAKVGKPGRLSQQNTEVEQAWWKAWHDEKLLDFIPSPSKWTVSDRALAPGDIVIFARDGGDNDLGNTPWRIGRVVDAKPGRDGVVRVVVIEYRNAEETVFRTTKRAVRKVAVLHREGDLDLLEQLNDASRINYMKHDLA